MSGSKNSWREENDLLLEQLEQMQDEIERKDIMIADLQRQRRTSENSSVVSMLKNKIREQSEEIVRLNEMIESLNEWIGRMSESDLILKENEQLKQRNSRLEDEKKDIEREAENTIRNCKKKVENAIGAAKEQKEKAESTMQRYNRLIQTEESKIEDRAEKMVSDKIVCLERQYQTAVGAYKSFWSMMLFFSAVLVVLLALKNKVFVSELLIFLTGLGETLRVYANGYAAGTISAVVMISGTVFACGVIVIAGEVLR